MATLETLRNRAGVLVAAVIGLALLAFILGDFSQGRSVFSSDSADVGSVDGTALSYQNFQQMFDNQINIMQAYSREGANTEAMSEQVRNQVWERFVRQQMLEREYDLLGLGFTTDELSSYIIGNEIHPAVRQIFTNPQTQEFDRQQMLNFLQNLESGVSPEQRAYWLEVEQEIMDERMMQKYVTLVAKGLGVTKFDVAFQDSLAASSVDAAYVFKPYSAEPDSLYKVSEAEAKAYYKQNREKYRDVTRRDMAYVSFPLKPGELDFEAAREGLSKLAQEFMATPEPMLFAQQNGDYRSKGAWVSESDLPSSVAAWLAEGVATDSLSPVLREGDEFMMARLIGRRSLPDSVKARHILFSFQKYPQAVAQQKADSVADLLRAGDGSFAAMAEELSDDPGSKSQGGDLGWFAAGRMVQPFNDACFEGRKGDITVVTTTYGVHVIEIEDQGGSSPRLQVAILSRKAEAGNHTYQTVFNQASAFASNAHVEAPSWWGRLTGKGAARKEQAEQMFDSLASAQNLPKLMANGIESTWARINGLDNSREMVRWAYEATPGDVSKVFELGDQFVVALLLRVRESEDGYATFEAVRDDVERDARLEMKREALGRRFAEAFKGQSDINALASSLGESVRRADGITFNAYAFGQEGFEPAAVGAASTLKGAQVAVPVVGNAGVFAIQAESVGANANPAPVDRASLQDGLRRNVSYEVLGSLRDMSDIRDNRARFF